MPNLRALCLYCFFLFIFFAKENLFAQKSFPQGLFSNPLDIPITLAGNFGECRPNHFHTGIDIKTNQEENLNVKSAADGEIVRIGVSHVGYGNVLYVKHNNGYTTVYGHLNDFAPKIQSYAKAKQYELRSWNLDLKVPEGTLPVKKGEMIAFSGNTGGSTSPHLHFEIRDNETEEVLNASLFGLPILDTKPPIAKQVAIYNSYLNIYQFAPQIINLVKKGNNYIANSVINVESDGIKIGVFADDIMEGTSNIFGIYEMRLTVNNKDIFATKMDKLEFAHNRYMNAYGDFSLFKKTGKWFQALYKLPHNQLPVYTLNENDGIIKVLPNQINSIKITLKDAFQNSSFIDLQIKTEGMASATETCSNDYYEKGKYQDEEVRFEFNSQFIYEPICFELTKNSIPNALSQEVHLLQSTIPMHNYGKLSLKVNRLLPFEWRDKLIFVHKIKEEKLPGAHPQEGIAASYENGWAVAFIRTLGAYYVAIDTTAPLVNISIKDGSNLTAAKSITFTAKESQTSLSEVNGYIDDQWVIFSRKGDSFTYKFDEHCPPGKHTLKIVAKDESGNTTVKELTFSN